MVVRGPDNPVLRKTVVALEKAGRKNKAPVWTRVAEMVKKGRRSRRQVNLPDLARAAGKELVVPGKVLGSGEAGKAVTVAALSFSASARQKIVKAGGKALSIKELVESNPTGKGVLIIG